VLAVKENADFQIINVQNSDAIYLMKTLETLLSRRTKEYK
jgi:hypothetical protein